MLRPIAIAAVTLVLGLAGAGSSAAAPPPAGVVKHIVDVPPDTITTVTVTCPKGYFAVFGGLLSGNIIFGGSTGPLLSATPNATKTGYTFRVGNPVTSPTVRITLAVKCVRPGTFKKGTLVVGPKFGLKKKAAVVVPPGGTTETKVTCPAGEAPTGPGFDENPAGAPKSTPRGAAFPHYPTGLGVHLTESMPVPGGWQFAAHNSGTVAAQVDLAVLCMQRHAARRLRGGQRATVDETVVRETRHLLVSGRSLRRSTASCPRGTTALGSGFRFASALDLLATAGPGPGRNGFAWNVENGEPHELPVDLFDLCLRQRTYTG
jgi:hypothetical protein